MHHESTNKKRVGMAILISNWAKEIASDKRGIIYAKGSIYQEYIQILSVYVTNSRILWYMKQKLTEMEGERDKFTIIFGI